MLLGRVQQEKREKEFLAPYALKSAESRGRKIQETPDPVRTEFQRDRDRIIHSQAFRKLQHKTQVYLVHEADLYRTRLTHTLEVAQIARGLAVALNLNEDITEAIALAHDLGHAPFGHAGEDELRRLTEGKFEHNLQSLRIIDVLEKRAPGYDGLNPTFELREGIAKHFTRYDNPKSSPLYPDEFKGYPNGSLEAQCVNLADVLAFCAHDLDDAIRVGLATIDDLKDLKNDLIFQALKEAQDRLKPFESSLNSYEYGEYLRRNVVRNIINIVIRDVESSTVERLKDKSVKSVEDVRREEEQFVKPSPKIEKDLYEVSQFLYDHVYMSPVVVTMVHKARKIIVSLYEEFLKNPKLMPLEYQARLNSEEKWRVVADYVASLTDRQAMDIYQMLFSPYTRVLFSPRG